MEGPEWRDFRLRESVTVIGHSTRDCFSSKNKNKEKVLQPREKLIISSGTTTKKTSAGSLFKQVEGMWSLTAHLPQARLS